VGGVEYTNSHPPTFSTIFIPYVDTSIQTYAAKVTDTRFMTVWNFKLTGSMTVRPASSLVSQQLFDSMIIYITIESKSVSLFCNLCLKFNMFQLLVFYPILKIMYDHLLSFLQQKYNFMESTI